MWLAIVFIIIGISSRLLPHIPNLSPLVAVALFSGVYWNKKYGYLLPLSIYILSDLIIGLHSTVIFTWSSILLIYLLGTYLRKRKTFANTALYTLSSSLLFFVITNFGVWLMGWYPHTPEGLLQCYMRAIPFFRTSLIGNFIYVGILFGAYEYFLARRVLAKETL
ncbi:MAG: hypothetical protein JSW40_09170 [Candidatus Omnitrophota bacterium]|nr:MAG: hypothetical protein JSW40_09170 [Candidatus Omnitrophota bacterium]